MEQFALDSGPFAKDPYPVFDRLRREAPVFWHEGLQAYVLTRYADCRRLNEDAANFYPSQDGRPPIPYVQELAGESHTRIRRMVNPAFTPRALAASVEPALPEIAEKLITPLLPRGRIEIVSEVGEAMATRVISKLLNVSKEDEKWMVKTADEMLEAKADPSNAALQSVYPAKLAALQAFFSERLRQEREAPSGTLISDLIVAAEQLQSLTEEELLANTMGIVIAGIETTKRLVSNLVYLLVSNPDQMQAVRDDLSLLRPAIEETLRIHSPNQPIIRWAQNDVEFHGVKIRAGTRVYGMRGAANRDPDAWRDPDVFNVRRFLEKGLPPHLAFGLGPHTCPGAYLARRETEILTGMLLKHTRNLRLDPGHEVVFVNFRNRGPRELHVLFDAA